MEVKLTFICRAITLAISLFNLRFSRLLMHYRLIEEASLIGSDCYTLKCQTTLHKHLIVAFKPMAHENLLV